MVILFGGMVVVMAVQWRTVSRVRYENRELQGVREQADQNRTELEQATQAAKQHESEVQSLRAEVVTLRSELQTVRFELGQVTNAVRQAALAAERSRSRLSGGIPSAPTFSAFQPPKDKRTTHLHPNALLNLSPRLPSSSYVHRSAGMLDGVELWNGITKETVLSGAAWSPSEPLPLSFSSAEEIARGELGRLVHDEPKWKLREIQLHRLWDWPQGWYYSIQFSPLDRPSSGHFSVFVGFSGATGTTMLKDDQ